MAERIADLFNGGLEDDGDLINSYFDQSSTTGEDQDSDSDEETSFNDDDVEGFDRDTFCE